MTEGDLLIKEVADKHGILLAKDDPLFILLTVTSRLIEDTKKSQEEIIEAFKQDMQNAYLLWQNHSVNKAEQVLNTALEESREAMKDILSNAATNTSEMMARKLSETVNATLTDYVKSANNLAKFNILSSALTLLAAILVVWVSLK